MQANLLQRLLAADIRRRKALQELQKAQEEWVLVMSKLQCFEDIDSLTAGIDYLFNKDTPFNNPNVSSFSKPTVLEKEDLQRQADIIKRLRQRK